MIDNSNPDYGKTLRQIEKLKSYIEATEPLEKQLEKQIPQGLLAEYLKTKKEFINWLEEIEFTIGDYT
ncbi:hypothetical protein ACFLQL_00555 [Verrucomicrobiota bacterium]